MRKKKSKMIQIRRRNNNKQRRTWRRNRLCLITINKENVKQKMRRILFKVKEKIRTCFPRQRKRTTNSPFFQKFNKFERKEKEISNINGNIKKKRRNFKKKRVRIRLPREQTQKTITTFFKSQMNSRERKKRKKQQSTRRKEENFKKKEKKRKGLEFVFREMKSR